MSQSRLVALPFAHLSAFADGVNSGNSAVIVFPSPEQDARLDDATRIALSANFNQPMTAFVIPHVEQSGETPLPAHARAFDIQYFTVADKVPLCGHATLCAASALFSDATRVSPDTTELYFIAENGKIVARKAEEGRIEIAIKAGEVRDFTEGDPREAQLRGAIEKAIGGQAASYHHETPVGVLYHRSLIQGGRLAPLVGRLHYSLLVLFLYKSGFLYLSTGQDLRQVTGRLCITRIVVAALIPRTPTGTSL